MFPYFVNVGILDQTNKKKKKTPKTSLKTLLKDLMIAKLYLLVILRLFSLTIGASYTQIWLYYIWNFHYSSARRDSDRIRY